MSAADLIRRCQSALPLPELPARPLQRVTVGPYRIRHADGHCWTLYPYTGMPLTRRAIEQEARRHTASVHGEVVAVEEVRLQ